jgi:hypothetical protein
VDGEFAFKVKRETTHVLLAGDVDMLVAPAVTEAIRRAGFAIRPVAPAVRASSPSSVSARSHR